MHIITPFLALAGIAGIADAIPAPEHKRTHSFCINQKGVRRSKPRNGARSVLQAYRKFGVRAPAGVKKAAARASSKTQMQQGSVVTTPEPYDSEYLTPVVVGGTTLQLDFDTGSADLWVYSSELPPDEVAGHAYYTVDPAKQLQGESWEVSYGDNSSASGDVYADTVSIGPVTADRQAIGAASDVSYEFTLDVDNDGLVGLAFSSINTVYPDQQLTFFDTVKDNLTMKLFAANLKYGAPGSYDFGYIDTTKFKSNLDYAPVDSSTGYWYFTSTGFAISGRRHAFTISGIADTGTTLLYLPSRIVNYYYSRVSGAFNSYPAGGWIFPCNARLPSFSLVVNGTLHTVPGRYINFVPYDGVNCFGGMQSDEGLPFSVFGDIFLKSQYVVFDQTTPSPRIGFGNQV